MLPPEVSGPAPARPAAGACRRRLGCWARRPRRTRCRALAWRVRAVRGRGPDGVSSPSSTETREDVRQVLDAGGGETGMSPSPLRPAFRVPDLEAGGEAMAATPAQLARWLVPLSDCSHLTGRGPVRSWGQGPQKVTSLFCLQADLSPAHGFTHMHMCTDTHTRTRAYTRRHAQVCTHVDMCAHSCMCALSAHTHIYMHDAYRHVCSHKCM